MNPEGEENDFSFGENWANREFSKVKTIEKLSGRDADVKSLFIEMDNGSQAFHEAYFHKFERDESSYMRRGRASLDFRLERSRRTTALGVSTEYLRDSRGVAAIHQRNIHAAAAASPRLASTDSN